MTRAHSPSAAVSTLVYSSFVSLIPLASANEESVYARGPARIEEEKSPTSRVTFGFEVNGMLRGCS
jgi:hypothetical protein